MLLSEVSLCSGTVHRPFFPIHPTYVGKTNNVARLWIQLHCNMICKEAAVQALHLRGKVVCICLNPPQLACANIMGTKRAMRPSMACVPLSQPAWPRGFTIIRFPLWLDASPLVIPPPPPGEWKDDNTRALLWRLLLGVIPGGSPPSEWAKEMASKRAQHRRLAAEHRVDIVNMSANPLLPGSGSGDDPWSHFYQVGLHNRL